MMRASSSRKERGYARAARPSATRARRARVHPATRSHTYQVLGCGLVQIWIGESTIFRRFSIQLTQLLYFGANERAIQVQVHQRLRCCIRLPQQNSALNGYNLFAPPPYGWCLVGPARNGAAGITGVAATVLAAAVAVATVASDAAVTVATAAAVLRRRWRRSGGCSRTTAERRAASSAAPPLLKHFALSPPQLRPCSRALVSSCRD